ncbi:MAG TPA: SDR family oxidoreductase [Jatrophihabitans sp.]|nr:SDR family oxidoreductase [Jatrophihabitans sp.]
MPYALITGASAGLGRVLAAGLAGRGWQLVLDARTEARLATAAAGLPAGSLVRAVAGDVADPDHRAELGRTVAGLPGLDLLVNNASTLGETPLPPLAEASLTRLRQVYEVNVIAPLALTQLLLGPLRRAGGTVLNVSSDAAVADYPGWGGYGSAKAALDQLTRTLAAEQPGLRCYSVDPGDMRTELHQAAYPGEDIGDRPEPESVVPALLRLLDSAPPSGRYRAVDLDPGAPAPARAEVASEVAR